MRSRKSRYINIARQAARRHGVPERLFLSMIGHESGWNPAAISSAGAVGLAQFMPGTARGLGIDPFDPKQALDGAAKYLKMKQEEFGSWKDALRAYNFGSGGAKANPQNGLGYANAVLGGRDEYGKKTKLPGAPALSGGPMWELPPPGGDFRDFGGGQDIWSILYPDEPDFAGLLRTAERRRLSDLGPTLGFDRLEDIPDQKGTKTRYVGPTLQLGTSWKGTHVTDGLDWNSGRQSAIDIMAKAGTPVGAPESGTIISWDNEGAQGGGRIIFRSDSGHLYWLGHLDNGLPAGTRVRRGQPIGVVSSRHDAPHVHADRYYGSNPGRYS